MTKRIISSVALIILLALTILLGKIAIFALSFIVGASALAEYQYVTNKNSSLLHKFIILGFGFIIMVTATLDNTKILAVIPMVIIGVFIINIISKNYEVEKSLYEIFGLIYIPFFISLGLSFLNIDKGIYIIYLIFIICFSTDTFAYLIGITFGKRKLCPEISPKKSVEGSLGGLAFSVIVTMLVGLSYSTIFNFPFYHYIFMAIIVSIISQFGDLTASMIKRTFKVKDYGKSIPGHGGLLDRIDSLLFAMCGMYFYMSVILQMI